ncbi:hypothetical protein [Clostridium sp.]|uniref:hypothetical protein n=1 Tax=Clostridium sp. TaxID=1506 RepID=UPI002846B3E6|nr:hypothetical protein [Clostridium sp.]MDR3598513.1 hypothetical protein [Clostridium sp.]
MRNIIIALPFLLLMGCIPPSSHTIYWANYSFSLSKVERPEKATQRYGLQKIDVLSSDKYSSYFEDDLVKVLWSVSVSNVSFSIQNKTDHSIKIPWDEASFIDANGSSHRVMHIGVKYVDRQQPQAPSIIARKASIEDLVFPTDYVTWEDGQWEEQTFFPRADYHSDYSKGTYPTFDSFNFATKSNIGKSIQILLPLQIEEVVNDYIFTFKVDSVLTSQETKK